MSELKLGLLALEAGPDHVARKLRVTIRGECDANFFFMTVAEWASLEAIGTVMAAADRELGRLRGQLTAIASRLENWDWTGLLRDAKRGDYSSAADALREVVEIEKLINPPVPDPFDTEEAR